MSIISIWHYIIHDVIKYCDQPRRYKRVPPGGRNSNRRCPPPIRGLSPSFRISLLQCKVSHLHSGSISSHQLLPPIKGLLPPFTGLSPPIAGLLPLLRCLSPLCSEPITSNWRYLTSIQRSGLQSESITHN